MNLPNVPEIAKLFALAADYDPNKEPSWPRWGTPKLNGLRAMWVPGAGFFSRDGVAYEPAILPHIEAALAHCTLWLDGELYSHGMSLQNINSRAGVVRSKPHADYAAISFNVFDSPHIPGRFDHRQNLIRDHLAAIAITDAVRQVDFRECKCAAGANSAHRAYVSMGYEGTVYKHPGSYQPGRSSMMLRRKAWSDGDFEVVRLVQGREGKFEHSMGAVVCRTPSGHEFEVGAFELTDEERLAIWFGPKPRMAKVRYLTLTDKGAPFNARVTLLY